jgi:hypothetical protein
MVIAPAKTGKEINNKKAVTQTVQTNNGKRVACMPLQRMLLIVTIKLIAPAIEDAPAKCKLNIAQSTDAPEWANIPLNGGYKVQPVPTPDSMKLDNNKSNKAGGSNQKLILFNRGKAISGLPIIIGTNQLPKPPIKIGMTIKNIIIKACAVTITLYNCIFPERT